MSASRQRDRTSCIHVGKYATLPSGSGSVIRDGYQGTTIPYKIDGGKLITFISQDPYAVTVYKLGDTYYGARSNEFGYANYEMIPNPQYVVEPVTELTDQFATELGLTEQQKQQIIPIVKEEIPKLQALKKDTSVSAEDKVRQLREIAAEVDAKITPLLNPEQQQRYQAARDRLRRRLIEKVGSALVEKVEQGEADLTLRQID